jgi:glycosyltransferase involved in cell wall biosynthesis
MNITIIGTAYPYRGGLAAYNERLAKEFIAEGKNVTIVTFSLQYPSFLFPGKSQYLDGPPPEGLNISRKVNSVNPFNWIRTGLQIRKQRPDILIFKYWLPFMAPCFGTIARLVKGNGHTKVITILDNVIPHEKRPGDRLLTKYYTSSIDGAIAMSASVLADLQNFRSDIPAKLNPHPLFDNFGPLIDRDKALGQLGLDPSCSYILFFGFIRKYKGLDLLLDAFARKELREMNIKLIIAGEFYEDDTPYHDLVKEYNLENEVIFFDRFINDDEVAAFFSCADLIVQPYRSATQSGVTQIAYHFGKPMLVTDVGGLREIVPDHKCGYVINPDPVSIFEALSDFYVNDRNEEYTRNVLSEREKFSWSKMTASVSEVYDKCINYDNKK